MWNLKKNLAKYFSMNMNSFLLVEDDRLGNHAKYQIGIKIKNQKEFNKVNDKLSNFLKTKHNCKKTNDGFFCKVNDDWKRFGQQEGTYRTLYPSNFEGNKVYVINHGVQERLMLEPSILTKNLLNSYVNELGRKYGTKKTILKKSMKKNNNKSNNSKTTKSKICNKYKDKAIRGTPVNWAYKKCMRQPIDRINTCKTLPPNGYGMYRYFCE